MNTRLLFGIILGLAAGAVTFAQPPGRPEGDPPRNGQMRPGGDGPQNSPPRKDDWMKRLDTNGDGKLDATELQAAIETSFKAWDKNGNGVIDAEEMPRPPHPPQQGNRPQGPPMAQGLRPNGPPMAQGDHPQGPPQAGQPNDKMLPPFFFADRNPEGAATNRADFERIVKSVFAEMDKNGDGVISGDEARPPRREGGPQGPPEGGAPPNGKFIAAELRFGDKLVTGQPFSAETVIEDTRLLFDGTLVKKEIRGNIYRDGNGRTRREMPLAMVGGVNVVGSDNKPQQLIFINDFASKTQYFLDPNTKVARKSRIGENQTPPHQNEGPAEAKTVSDGIKTIDGISCQQTRTEFEIPVGQVGNQKALKVVSENCFSAELQVVIMSLHQDPMNGIHIFKLVNIKRAEPSVELFTVPNGYRIEAGPGKE